MNEQARTQEFAGRREQLQDRFTEWRRSRQQALLRWPEIIGLGASALMIAAVVFAYLSLLLPARARLDRLQAERGELQRRLRDAETGLKRNTDAQASLSEIRESLSAFEQQYLTLQRGPGRTAIIQEMNDLIKANNLRLTSNMSFAAQGGGADPQTKIRTITGQPQQHVFPAVAITLSVEGSYADLRRFIRDVESSKQFVTIDSVDLERADEGAGATRVLDENGEVVAAGGSLPVSLRLNLTAYFQREAGIPAPAGAG